MQDKPIIFWIDLFCGAGGTTTGITNSPVGNQVIACINHDQNAIESHRLNHPHSLHLTEDVRDLKVVAKLAELVRDFRRKHPGCFINLWASLECTNYSKAKGGLPREADSRTLAHHLLPYLEEITPDYLYIENVVEFMAWGPLNECGQPVSRKNGRDFLRWKDSVCSLGYHYDYRLLNAADYGAHTIRKRYFAQFARPGLPIRWPQATHCSTEKNLSEREKNLFGQSFRPWRPVREVLDLRDEGLSIFARKKPLAENTLKRIYAGLLKFVARPKADSSDDALNSKEFLSTYYKNGSNLSLDSPSPTLTTKNRISKVLCTRPTAQYITSYYLEGKQLTSLDQPNPTVRAQPKQRLRSYQFLDQQYGCSKPSSVEQPSGAITANPKLNLVSVDAKGEDSLVWDKLQDGKDALVKKPDIGEEQWLLNPQYSNKGSSINQPAPTLIARMDKKPLYLVHPKATGPQTVLPKRSSDSPTMKLIIAFMQDYGVADIKMRMLNIRELLRIQGFPENYYLQGTMTEQKKFIGNSVHTFVARKLCEANYRALYTHIHTGLG